MREQGRMMSEKNYQRERERGEKIPGRVDCQEWDERRERERMEKKGGCVLMGAVYRESASKRKTLVQKSVGEKFFDESEREDCNNCSELIRAATYSIQRERERVRKREIEEV